MEAAHANKSSGFLLTVLLGAVLSILCMSLPTHAQKHLAHDRTLTQIVCPPHAIPADGCTLGHNLFIDTSAQLLAATTILVILLSLICWVAFRVWFTTPVRAGSKRLYKARSLLGRRIYAKHILDWQIILHKQDSYAVAVV